MESESCRVHYPIRSQLISQALLGIYILLIFDIQFGKGMLKRGDSSGRSKLFRRNALD